jgi:tRNA 2-selenouridine synthase
MPAQLREIDDLKRLFLEDVPLLDVRAPVEFAEGAFPAAENHPLVDDDERHRIGITYKEEGQDEAIALGEALVRGEVRAARLERWRAFLAQHPDAVLYCFRGGMRSKISQRWLHEYLGIDCPRVRGGYKAMRRYLLDQIEQNSACCRPVVVGGRTGVGKTRFLLDCDAAIDLEGLAHHRGSAFGHHPEPQPTQIDFENAFSIALMKRVADGNRPFLVEDESRHVGSRHVPPGFFARMEQAPLVLLEAGFDERVEITRREYVDDALAEFRRARGEDRGFQAWSDYLRDAMKRIRRRLGGERHQRVSRLLEDALARHRRTGDIEAHREWIAVLLRDYYDGMYEYQLSRKQERVVFSGARDALAAYLREQHGIGQRPDGR